MDRVTSCPLSVLWAVVGLFANVPQPVPGLSRRTSEDVLASVLWLSHGKQAEKGTEHRPLRAVLSRPAARTAQGLFAQPLPSSSIVDLKPTESQPRQLERPAATGCAATLPVSRLSERAARVPQRTAGALQLRRAASVGSPRVSA
jgi:hypothetical protein